MLTRPVAGRLRAVSIVMAVGLLVAGCSGSTSDAPNGSGTSGGTAAASAAGDCAQVSAELTKVGDEISGLPGKIPSDIPGAISSVESVASSLKTLGDTVTDPELRSKITTLTDSVSTLQTALENASNDPIGSAGDLLDAVAAVRTAYNDLKVYCGVE